MADTCACGCGGQPNTGKRFIRTHNKTIIPMRRLQEAMASPGSCWVWPGRLSHGYGKVTTAGVTQQAHRWVWELLRGPIPDGLVLDHLCRNTACVNPDHLEPVTGRVNILRGVGWSAIKARQTHCKHGHEFTPENTYYPPGRKRRQCMACRRVWSANFRRLTANV